MRVLLARWLLISMALSGCEGEFSSTPEELARFDFAAQVQVNPGSPLAGRTMSVNLEVTSRSNQLVVVDLALRAVRANGRVMHVQSWPSMTFHPDEVWNLTQGFFAASDERGAVSFQIEVIRSDTKVSLWKGEGPSVVIR